MLSKRIRYGIFTAVMFLCVVIISLASFASLNSSCKYNREKLQVFNLCGG